MNKEAIAKFAQQHTRTRGDLAIFAEAIDPGGQALALPPQQAHKWPPSPQYRQ